jgi:hypothetical protein
MPGEKEVILTRLFNSIALALTASLQGFGSGAAPEEFLRTQMQLSAGQIAGVQNGRAFARILPSSNASDIFVSGVVYIHAKPAAYLELMKDMTRWRKVAGYLGAGEFSASPNIRDLNGLSLERDDIEDLKKCSPGDCELQLPEESMESSRASLQWNSPDIAEQVAILAKRGIVRLLKEYKQGGDPALLPYRDKRDPMPPSEQFRSFLGHLELFPRYLPDLNRYLLRYPNSRPEETQDFFYWEKVNFGLKPTIRVNHAIIYRTSGPQAVHALAIKQLYATHYFQTALDLSFCVPDSTVSGNDGFYLITVKGSRQAGLTGVKGGLVRKVVITRTRESLERALNSIRENLEHRTGSQE